MKKHKLNSNVILTGFTSFFTDISSEMIYPLLQAFITMVMAAQKALLGPVLAIIEGIAESTASLTKVYSGYLSDRIKKRKSLTIVGYTASAFSKFLLLIASLGWYLILLFRFFDRLGKGIRTAPRDALIAESSHKKARGKSFGFQRGMDFAGAALGTLLSFFLVRHFLDPSSGNLKSLDSFFVIFFISIIPAFIGVIFLLFLKDIIIKKTAVPTKKIAKPRLSLKNYSKSLKIFFLAQLIFTLGNSSNQFLLWRSMDLGHTLSTVILMYFSFNVVSTVLSPVLGSLSDRIGRKKLLIAGYLLYALVYLCFGFITAHSQLLLWFFWPLYGVYYAFTEGVEKAFVADIAPREAKATALGFFHTIVGISLFPANLIAGFLLYFSRSAPFIWGGILAAVAVLIIGLMVKEKSS